MSSFGIYNLTNESSTIEFKRNDGTITFPNEQPTTLASNTVSTGFCISPFEQASGSSTGNTVTLSGIPVGVNGSVRITANGTTRSVSYSGLDTVSKKLAWLTSSIPELTTTLALGQPTITVSDRTTSVLITFIDEDIDYVVNKFTANNNVLLEAKHHMLQLGFNINE